MHPSFPASTTVRRRIRLPLRGDGGAARRARVQGPRLELRELRRLSASPHPLHWTRPAAPRTAPFLTRARPLLLRRYGRAARTPKSRRRGAAGVVPVEGELRPSPWHDSSRGLDATRPPQSSASAQARHPLVEVAASARIACESAA